MADWKNVHLAEKNKRIAELEAENARLTALVHQLGENAATAAREYAEGMEGLRGALRSADDAVQDSAQGWRRMKARPLSRMTP